VLGAVGLVVAPVMMTVLVTDREVRGRPRRMVAPRPPATAGTRLLYDMGGSLTSARAHRVREL